MALVSIIVPAYNAEKHLYRCLSSVAAQDVDDVEVLVVDDASTDASSRIVQEFAAGDVRFRYVALERNQGVMAARAVGVALCSGKFIGFVDADDWVEPRMISSMLNRLQADGSDIAICGVSYVDDQGVRIKGDFRFSKDRLITDGLSQFANRKLGSAYLWNKLYRRETIFGDASHDFGVRLKLGEDILINMGAFAHARSVSLLSEVFYNYTQNPLGITESVDNAEAFANLLLAYSLCCAHFKNLGVEVLCAVDSFFRAQFNFRCYQVADMVELAPHRELLSLALRLLSDSRPEAVLCLMNTLKRKGRSSSALSEGFQRLFG